MENFSTLPKFIITSGMAETLSKLAEGISEVQCGLRTNGEQGVNLKLWISEKIQVLAKAHHYAREGWNFVKIRRGNFRSVMWTEHWHQWGTGVKTQMGCVNGNFQYLVKAHLKLHEGLLKLCQNLQRVFQKCNVDWGPMGSRGTASNGVCKLKISVPCQSSPLHWGWLKLCQNLQRKFQRCNVDWG